MNYLIDTNICIYLMKHHPPEVVQRFRSHSIGSIGISAITLSELQFGVAKSQHPQKNQIRLNEFLQPFILMPYSSETAKIYGEIRAELSKQGQLIGPLDLLIAAHAKTLGVTLVTNNVKEFERVGGLSIENWVEG